MVSPNKLKVIIVKRHLLRCERLWFIFQASADYSFVGLSNQYSNQYRNFIVASLIFFIFSGNAFLLAKAK